MARGPRAESHPADVIGAAIMVGRIAVGDIRERRHEPSGKVRSGLAGEHARADNMTSEERGAVARKAASAWSA